MSDKIPHLPQNATNGQSLPVEDAAAMSELLAVLVAIAKRAGEAKPESEATRRDNSKRDLCPREQRRTN